MSPRASAKLLARGHELKIVEPEAVERALDEGVAVLMFTEVDYRTGRLHDMRCLTEKAKAVGTVTIWDLCSFGRRAIRRSRRLGADFAVGCGYKYLNGGPGAPAFLYVRPDLQESVAPAAVRLDGPCGALRFRDRATGRRQRSTGSGPARRRCSPWRRSTAALDVFDGVDMQAVRERSIALGEAFMRRIEARLPRTRARLAARPRAARLAGLVPLRSTVTRRCRR